MDGGCSVDSVIRAELAGVTSVMSGRGEEDFSFVSGTNLSETRKTHTVTLKDQPLCSAWHE